jgi:hypothetical protein
MPARNVPRGHPVLFVPVFVTIGTGIFRQPAAVDRKTLSLSLAPALRAADASQQNPDNPLTDT